MNFDLNFAIQNLWMAFSGVPTTLLITFVAAVIGIPLAFFIALARIRKVPLLDQFLTLYLSFMRGTPTIVQIYLVYNGIPIIIKMIVQALNLDFDVYSIPPILYAFIVYGLNSSATYSEMWKAGLSAVGRGQLEAAQTSGLTNFQAYVHVIIPQAVGVCAPSFCSSTLNMLEKYIPCIFDDGAGYYSQGKNRSRTAVQICRRLFGYPDHVYYCMYDT